MPAFMFRVFVIRDICDCLCRHSLDNLIQFFFNHEDRFFLVKGMLVEILHEDLRDDMKVILVVFKDNCNQIEYLIDICQLELIFVN